MGWHPDQVRNLSVSDFLCAFEGWKMINCAETGPNLSDDEIDDLAALMAEDEARYGGRAPSTRVH